MTNNNQRTSGGILQLFIAFACNAKIFAISYLIDLFFLFSLPLAVLGGLKIGFLPLLCLFFTPSACNQYQICFLGHTRKFRNKYSDD